MEFEEAKDTILKKIKNDEDLSYMIGRYCGRGNTILREKTFGWELSRYVERVLKEEMASRSFEDIFLSDN
jgi:hypothetical protein